MEARWRTRRGRVGQGKVKEGKGNRSACGFEGNSAIAAGLRDTHSHAGYGGVRASDEGTGREQGRGSKRTYDLCLLGGELLATLGQQRGELLLLGLLDVPRLLRLLSLTSEGRERSVRG